MTPLTGDDSGTAASYLIPSTIYERQIEHYMLTRSQIIPRVRKIKMTGRLHQIPITSTEMALTFVTNEVTDKTESIPTFNSVDLEAETFACWAGCTDELMEDTFADIGAHLTLEIRQDLLDKTESSLLNSSSPFTGILQASGTSEEVTGGPDASDTDWEDLLEVKHNLSSRRQQDGVYVINPEVWESLVINTVDAMGRYYFDPSKAGPYTVWGRSLYLSDNMPSLASVTSSTKFMFFGNLYYTVLGIRVPLEVKYYSETMYAVQDNENFFRFRTRFGTKVVLPGAYSCLKTSTE